jgi:predicted nucleic acid-binding protein
VTEHWIIDASPLILLGKAGQLDWLLQMGRIVVPESVAAEVVAGAPDDPARRWLEAPQGAASIVRDDAATNDLLAWDLGAGEIAVIATAMANPGYEAVLDDAAARRCAMVLRCSHAWHSQLRGARQKARVDTCLPTGL